MRRLLFGVLLVLVLTGHSWAGRDEGMAALKKGDYATALREYRPLAEQGNAIAQYVLGMMYAEGQGVPQDAVQAVRWYRKAAAQGDALAQFALGMMYVQGRVVPQDFVTAHMWLNLATAQGQKEAGGIRIRIRKGVKSTSCYSDEVLATPSNHHPARREGDLSCQDRFASNMRVPGLM